MERSTAFVVEFKRVYVHTFAMLQLWSDKMLLQSRVNTGVCVGVDESKRVSLKPMNVDERGSAL